MKILPPRSKDNRRRRVYASAEQNEGDEFFVLSRRPEVANGRRPVALFDTRQELGLEASRRGCEVLWLTS